jgi:transposase
MAWYPKLNSIPNKINYLLPFGNNIYKNTSYEFNEQFIDNTFLKTIKLKIYPTINQQTIINSWFALVNKVYNYTNQYIKNKICTLFPYIDSNNIIHINYKFINDIKLIKETLNFINLRKILNVYINQLKTDSHIYKHTLDYAVKLCIEMYKSCYSNYKANNIKHFNVKDILQNKKRFNLTLEPCNFDKKQNAFCFSTLGIMKSDKQFRSLKLNHNINLQYDQITKCYYLLIPIDSNNKEHIYREKKCGIDIGCRTFMTIYSNNKCVEIGNDKIINQIDKVNNKLDKLKSHLDTNKINENIYKKVKNKYELKIRNKIKDMHKKTANYLLKNYEIINIGKVSIKSMISKLKGNIRNITKRRLLRLSHYSFREYLKLNALKYGNIINEIDEYQTTQLCHNCGNIKKDIGCNKIYNCNQCNIKLDRDVNASINIYRL